MPTIERAGATIWVSEAGRGAPVLLVHGGLFDRMDSERFWGEPGIADDLLRAHYNVLMLDRRFCGRTSAPYGLHSWQIEGDDLMAVLRAAATPSAHIVAGSNGCSAAVRLALSYPRLVRSLVLCWPVAPETAAAQADFERSAEAIERLGPPAYLEMLRTDGVPRPDEDRPGHPYGFALLRDPHCAARFLDLDAGAAAAIMRESGQALLPGNPIRGVTEAECSALGARGIPVAVMPAEPDDPSHPPAVAEALVRAIPGARLTPGFPVGTGPRFRDVRAAFGATLRDLLSP